ncbi:AI-2E family transporter [Leucobacter sp. Psy1]|uniref:AI-2E family transporter n=1 Tax=Leucobacter sp. Psy1 TaxID=2875729 RepID=UPI001CD6F58A|nr:AI-2E family transporter [Leucobacter sp. Psy1]
MSRSGRAGLTTRLVSLAAFFATAAGIYFARGIVAPFVLALVLVIILYPVRRGLRSRGAPDWVSSLSLVTLAWGAVAAGVVLVIAMTDAMIDIVVSHRSDMIEAQEQLQSLLTSTGLSGSFDGLLRTWFDPASLVEFLSRSAGALTGAVFAVVLVMLYATFLAFDASRFERVLGEFSVRRIATVRRLSGCASAIRRFIVVNTTFGMIVAVLDGILLAVLSVPSPLVWALLAFVTNFIPSIGFVIGVAPPALLAFLVGDWHIGLAVILGYSIINVVLQSFVQPKFVSHAVDLSLTLTFLSVIVWTVLLGPTGAILAVPLTLLARAVLLDDSETSRLARWITGDESESRGEIG